MVAVTGSVGKTTTRQLIDQVLASAHQGTASRRNHNNHLGVPLSMLAWSAEQDYAEVDELISDRPAKFERSPNWPLRTSV